MLVEPITWEFYKSHKIALPNVKEEGFETIQAYASTMIYSWLLETIPFHLQPTSFDEDLEKTLQNAQVYQINYIKKNGDMAHVTGNSALLRTSENIAGESISFESNRYNAVDPIIQTILTNELQKKGYLDRWV